MADYRFEYDPIVPSGRVIFRATNVGTVPHQLFLLPLTEDFPLIDVQLNGPERRILTPFAEMPAQQPGVTAAFAVDLVAGQRYALICFMRDADGKSHTAKGMSSEFRAGGVAPPTSSTPKPPG